MTYKTEIIARIKDSDKWPAFTRPDFLQELNDVADDAFSKGTVEGYLASVLIYHQITEEMIKLLVECCEFLVQIAVFPREIQFRHGDRSMFGKILNELENTLSFEHKREFIEKCNELNRVRIRMVHKLTAKSSLADIKRQSLTIKDIFDQIYRIQNDIYNKFRVSFHSYKKDTNWEELL